MSSTSYIRWGAALVLCSMVAPSCTSMRPPAGPAYVESHSPEAATACPGERRAAQEAREAMLGVSDRGIRESAAGAVLVQARCEAAAAVRLPTPSGSQKEILGSLRIIRKAVQDVRALLAETRRYGGSSDSIESLLTEASLVASFANVVAAVPTPSELDARAATSFRGELKDAQRVLRVQAEQLLLRVLDAGLLPGFQTRACEALHALGRTNDACSR